MSQPTEDTYVLINSGNGFAATVAPDGGSSGPNRFNSRVNKNQFSQFSKNNAQMWFLVKEIEGVPAGETWWHFVQADAGSTFQVINVDSNGEGVIQSVVFVHGQDNQLWAAEFLDPQQRGANVPMWRFRNKQTGTYLDIGSTDLQNGTQLLTRPVSNDENQAWFLLQTQQIS